MKKFMEKLENVYAAAAFAEAGEFDTAREMMKDEDRPQKREQISPRERPRKQLKAPGMKR